jgi:hypothetical protein
MWPRPACSVNLWVEGSNPFFEPSERLEESASPKLVKHEVPSRAPGQFRDRAGFLWVESRVPSVRCRHENSQPAHCPDPSLVGGLFGAR